MTEAIRSKLAHEAGPVQWSDLQAHAKRDGLLLVHGSLDLVDVAYAVAIDATDDVKAWLAAAKLTRPSAEQLKQWNELPTKPFIAVVVQPFALAKLSR